jgi:nitroimidazol reductase NimA-like FMN-containing flavoprotein (pyridoxamine 5'-phosphate oxidase superfamily)
MGDSGADTSDYVVQMDVLEPTLCWRLIARTRFGRVGFSSGDKLCVLPVNCGVLAGQVVFRTGDDTSLGAMGDGTAVVFETDHVDDVAEAGWSVIVTGNVSRVVAGDELARLAEFDLHPWAPGPKDRWMKIVPTEVTGRAVSRHRQLPSGVHVPYMPPD